MAGIPSVDNAAQIMWQLQQQQAQTDLLNADTQYKQVQTQSAKQAMQFEAKNQQAQEDYRQQVLSQALLGPVNQNNPKTESINATEDARSDPNTKMMETLRSDRQRVVQNIQLAQATPGINPAPWVAELGRIDNTMRQTTSDITKQKAEKSKETANIMGAVDSPQGASAALQHIADEYGMPAALSIDKKLAHDPQTGDVLWNEPNKQVFRQYQNQFKTGHEQATESQNKLNWQLNVEKADEAQRYHDAEIKQKDADLAQKRDAVTARERETGARIASSERNTDARIKAGKERFDQTMEATGLKREVDVTKQDQQRLYKLGDTYKIIDYQKGNEVASRAMAQLQDPKTGYQSITPEQAFSMVKQAKLMMDNYRARTGGKYEDTQINRMNSLLGKVEKFVTTIGEGDKLLAKNEMLNLAQEMRTLYGDRNADLLRDELSVAQNTNKKGGNATFLNMQGNMDAAIDSGRAQKVTANGKEYVIFNTVPGKKPTKDDMYELPSEPERRSRYLPIPVSE